MKTDVRAVVIGGGVVGCSILYHLAKIGWTDVALIEKNELTSGSTWHAAGGMHTFNGDANVSKLQKYTIDLYRELEALTGQSCGIHANGGLMLAANEGEMDYLRLVVSRARYLGMDTEIIPVAEAKRRNVLIEERYFTGALWRADGGHVDPWGTTQAYAAAARKLGAEIHRFTKVDRPQAARRRVVGRRHRQGRRSTPSMSSTPVGCGRARSGGWSGVELPVLAMEHHYIVTEAIPELEGLEREIINTTDFSGEIYVRQEGKGALLGTYEHACVPVVGRHDAGRLPLAAPAGRLRPHRARARGRLPAFSGRRPGRREEVDQRAVHLRAGRQSAGRPGQGPAELLGRLRRHGRVQPGRRHRPRPVALDGGGRSRARTCSPWTSPASAPSRRRATPRPR